MPRFRYTVAGTDQPPRQFYADDLPQAFELVRAAVKDPVVLLPAESAAPAFRKGIREDVLVALYEELASLLAQGMELSVALRQIAAGAGNRRLVVACQYLAKRVAEGSTLSEGMAEMPRVFAPFLVSAIRAAEESGDLVSALRSLANHRRDIQRIGQDVSLPLAYPTFLLVTIALLLSFFGWILWPKWQQLYTDLGMRPRDFPALTRLTLVLAGIARLALPPLIILGVALLVFWLVRRRALRGDFQTRPLGLPVPLFGKLARYSALARLCASLRLLLTSGVPLHRALRLAGDATGSYHISLAMRRAEDVVLRGGPLAEGLRETGLLPDEFVSSLTSAEATGEFVPALQEIETDFMRRLGYLSRTWVVLAGPIVVVLLGCTVGLMGLSIFLPLVTIMSNLAQ